MGEPIGIESLEQALAIAQGRGDRRGVANALGALGNWYRTAGELSRAVALFREATKVAVEIGDLRTASAALGNLGSSLRGIGAVQDALDSLRRAQTLAEEIKDGPLCLSALVNLGNCYQAIGDVQDAVDHYARAREFAHRTGDRKIESVVLVNLASCYRSLGELPVPWRAWTVRSSLGARSAIDGLRPPRSAISAAATPIWGTLPARLSSTERRSCWRGNCVTGSWRRACCAT